jgi:hypothetical protein
VSKLFYNFNSPNHSPLLWDSVDKTEFDINKKACNHLIYRLLMYFDIDIRGELGIRTPGPFNKSTVFKTAAIDHSANSPGSKVQIPVELANLMLTFFQ